MSVSPSYVKRIAATGTVLGLAAIGIAAAPKPAAAWYNYYGYGAGVYVPPVVVAPPPVYSPPAAYYAPPSGYYAPQGRVWIPAHWRGNYWVPGHWS